MEGDELDTHPELRRTVGTCQDEPRARKFTGVLLADGIDGSDTLPAEHSDGSEPASEQERAPGSGTDIL